jgi:S-formylglutathione hydrolase FrmB
MNTHHTKNGLHFSILFFLMVTPLAFSQTGTLVHEILHSVALEQTLTEESPDRAVSIYLPPSYDTSPDKRYPVVYLLHGVGDNDETWTSGTETLGNLQSVMAEGITEGKFGEMIIVMPNEQRTIGGGSYYLNSSVTGNWEDFTTNELVAFMDTNYRTIAKAKARGIAGHSMGGYGAITLGMKHPDVYSVVYGMNPSLIGWQWGGDLTIESPAYTSVLEAKSVEELFQLNDNFYAAGIVIVAQAFSPNPDKRPFFADFPFALVAGKLWPSEPAFSTWQELNPVNMVDEYRANLLQLRGLRFDSGYDDAFKYIPINSRALSVALTNNGINHIFEEYNGDHSNRMWGVDGRLYNEVLPYFWTLLESSRQEP